MQYMQYMQYMQNMQNMQHMQHMQHMQSRQTTNTGRRTGAQQLFGVLVAVVRAEPPEGFGTAVQLQMHQPLHDVGFDVVVVDQLPHVQVQQRPRERHKRTGGTGC